MDAISQIHSDLASLKQRRRFALVTYVAIIGVFLGSVYLQPGPETVTRDPMWSVAFALLLVGALLGAAVTIGYPLVSRKTVYILSGLMGLGTVVALLLVMEPAEASGGAPISAGLKCFVTGTSISTVAMIALGVVSGQVWRRFPDPGFVMAIGMTGVGLGFLHMRCGGVDPLHLMFHLAPMGVLYAVAYFAVRTRIRLLKED